MTTHYSFHTEWQIEAPVEDIWDAIVDTTSWPEWWKGVEEVNELSVGNAEGIGAIRWYCWKSVLPYRLSFQIQLTEKQDYQNLKGIAFGELEGLGEWIFTNQHNITTVHCKWNVQTNKWWMNIFSLLLKTAFAYNHKVVMLWGAEGLAKKLQAKFISY